MRILEYKQYNARLVTIDEDDGLHGNNITTRLVTIDEDDGLHGNNITTRALSGLLSQKYSGVSRFLCNKWLDHRKALPNVLPRDACSGDTDRYSDLKLLFWLFLELSSYKSLPLAPRERLTKKSAICAWIVSTLYSS